MNQIVPKEVVTDLMARKGMVRGIALKNHEEFILKVIDLDEQGHQATVSLEDFALHPLPCQHLKGYFASVVKMVVGGKVTCRETKCSFANSDHHEFLLKWQ